SIIYKATGNLRLRSRFASPQLDRKYGSVLGRGRHLLCPRPLKPDPSDFADDHARTSAKRPILVNQFASAISNSCHCLTALQSTELGWVSGLRPEEYSTQSLRRTKASIIYKATGNLHLSIGAG